MKVVIFMISLVLGLGPSTIALGQCHIGSTPLDIDDIYPYTKLLVTSNGDYLINFNGRTLVKTDAAGNYIGTLDQEKIESIATDLLHCSKHGSNAAIRKPGSDNNILCNEVLFCIRSPQYIENSDLIRLRVSTLILDGIPICDEALINPFYFTLTVNENLEILDAEYYEEELNYDISRNFTSGIEQNDIIIERLFTPFCTNFTLTSQFVRLNKEGKAWKYDTIFTTLPRASDRPHSFPSFMPHKLGWLFGNSERVEILDDNLNFVKTWSVPRKDSFETQQIIPYKSKFIAMKHPTYRDKHNKPDPMSSILLMNDSLEDEKIIVKWNVNKYNFNYLFIRNDILYIAIRDIDNEKHIVQKISLTENCKYKTYQ